MWWFVFGIVAVWILVAGMVGIWFGLALRTADIEDEADRLRRDDREERATDAATKPDLGSHYSD